MRGVLLRMRAHGRPAAVSTLTVALATNQLASAATILTSGTSFIIFFTRVSGTSLQDSRHSNTMSDLRQHDQQ
jgi:hypothetical protein